jgi:SAM-dependent methyltransferase
MIERILAAARESRFDFREFANPADPLRDRFPEWVEYYRLKAAIAEVLQPVSILEIGVRFGYSAAAFLHGAPQAQYTGIDLDVNAFGGSAGGLDFARSLLPSDRVTLIRADSQQMEHLPGGCWDLVHIDGQQDGAGTYHDLELACGQGRHVLVDGYFWTQENLGSCTDFLLKHRDIIEWALVLPGYAGELLIRIRESHLESARKRGHTSAALRECYGTSYFLNDCGGWEFFRRDAGHGLEDGRLQSLFALVMLHRPRRLLDLGCGRGEICFHAARNGVSALGIDYSPDAIAIAEGYLRQEPNLESALEFRCGDVLTAPLEGPFDTILAGDLVEHLAPEELERLFERLVPLLAPGGRFIIHTFPNEWFYRYDYPRRRREALKLGAFLSPQPRSRFERLMHVNEQNPRQLRRAIRRHFGSGEVWFGSPEQPAASLQRKLTPRLLAAQRDLYALAPANRNDLARVAALFTSAPLPPAAAAGFRLWSHTRALRCVAGSTISIPVQVKNQSDWPIASIEPWPVFLSYHWLDSNGRVVVVEGHRNRLTCPQAPGTCIWHRALVQLPAEPGTWRLRLTLVQERVMWFDAYAPEAVLELETIVDPSTDSGVLRTLHGS